MRNYLVLQRHIIPTHKYAAEKGATSDPHDEMAPQKIGEILDGGWARKGIVVTRPEEQLLIATDMQDHPRASPKDASSRLTLQVHC